MKNGNSKSTWKSVLEGGIPGILLGASGTLLAQGFVSAPDETANEDGIPVAHTPNDEMSFREAFEAARAEVGPGGAFIWHGNVYSTYRADDPEWIAMGPEGQAEHCHAIMMEVHPEAYTPNQNEATQSDSERSDDPQDPEESDDPVEEPEPLEADVQITDIQTDPESGETAAIGRVDGVMTVFIDEDGDGVVDTVLHDDDGNGQVGSDEIYSAEGSGITIGELAGQMDQGSDVNLYEDQPNYAEEEVNTDYNNQADVEGF